MSRNIVFFLLIAFSSPINAAKWEDWTHLIPSTLGGLEIEKKFPSGANLRDLSVIRAKYGSRQAKNIFLELEFDKSGNMIKSALFSYFGFEYKEADIEADPTKRMGKFTFSAGPRSNKYQKIEGGYIVVFFGKHSKLLINTNLTTDVDQLKKLAQELPLDKIAATLK